MRKSNYRAEAEEIAKSGQYTEENYLRLKEICSLSGDSQVCQYIEAFIAASPANASFT